MDNYQLCALLPKIWQLSSSQKPPIRLPPAPRCVHVYSRESEKRGAAEKRKKERLIKKITLEFGAPIRKGGCHFVKPPIFRANLVRKKEEAE